MEKLISVTVFKHSELVCVFYIFVNMSACAVHECILGCVCSNQLPKKMLVVSFSMGKRTKQLLCSYAYLKPYLGLHI